MLEIPFCHLRDLGGVSGRQQRLNRSNGSPSPRSRNHSRRSLPVQHADHVRWLAEPRHRLLLGRPDPDARRRRSRLERRWGLYEYNGDELRTRRHAARRRTARGRLDAGKCQWPGETPEAVADSPEIDRGRSPRTGRTLYFLSPDPASGQGPPELYVRHDGKSTLVSRTEDGEPAPSGASGPPRCPLRRRLRQFVFGSPDGTTAIFQSAGRADRQRPERLDREGVPLRPSANTITYLPEVGGGHRRSPPPTTASASSSKGGGLGVWDHGTVKTFSNLGGELTPARATADGSVFVFRARDSRASTAASSSRSTATTSAEEQLGCRLLPTRDGVPARGRDARRRAPRHQPELRDVPGRQSGLLHSTRPLLSPRTSTASATCTCGPPAGLPDLRRPRPTPVAPSWSPATKAATTSSSRPNRPSPRTTPMASTTSTTPGSDGGFKQKPR